jgi:hypothetical protein
MRHDPLAAAPTADRSPSSAGGCGSKLGVRCMLEPVSDAIHYKTCRTTPHARANPASRTHAQLELRRQAGTSGALANLPPMREPGADEPYPVDVCAGCQPHLGGRGSARASGAEAPRPRLAPCSIDPGRLPALPGPRATRVVLRSSAAHPSHHCKGSGQLAGARVDRGGAASPAPGLPRHAAQRDWGLIQSFYDTELRAQAASRGRAFRLLGPLAHCSFA